MALLFLQPGEYEELIRSLKHIWAASNIPSRGFIYLNSDRVIDELLSATQDLERTRLIFEVVVKQASKLGKNVAWVERELFFEAFAESIDRADLLLLDLQCSEKIDDAALDLYNERQTRFLSTKRL